jgi:hypothetical protein
MAGGFKIYFNKKDAMKTITITTTERLPCEFENAEDLARYVQTHCQPKRTKVEWKSAVEAFHLSAKKNKPKQKGHHEKH